MTATASMAHNLAQCRILVQKAVKAGAKVNLCILKPDIRFNTPVLILSRPSSSPKQATTLPARRKRALPSSSLSTTASSSRAYARKLAGHRCPYTLAFMNPVRITTRSRTLSSG